MNTLARITRITRITRIALLAAAAAVLVGCSSSSGSTPVDRSTSAGVAAAFSAAWGSGDLTTACSYTAADAKTKLARNSRCSGHAGWDPQTPRIDWSCTNKNGTTAAGYKTDKNVDDVFYFVIQLGIQPDKNWAVTGLSEYNAGSAGQYCDDDAKIVLPG